MDGEEKRLLAVERVKEIRSFYTHLIFYILISLLLFAIDTMDRWAMWFYWPFLFFTVLIVAHAVRVYAFRGILGPRWEERKVRQFMAQLDRAEDECRPEG